ncbi:MAG: hypothetical protein U0457_15585 [Candidatus Sericytochromatia bacterium]
MSYENIKTLIENKFTEGYLDENKKISALNIWDKIFPFYESLSFGNEDIYLASVIFYAFDELGETKNFKQISNDFFVDPKALALKVKEISSILQKDGDVQHIMKRGISISETEKKQKHSVNTKKISDELFIESIKAFKDFVKTIFPEKDFFEIKTFLKLFILNLSMAGYDLSNLEAEKKFGELFIHFSFEPKKGREPDKFVNLRDRFNNYEPFTLIKLDN